MICKDMNGSKCAEAHCPYWDKEEHDCSIALLTKRKLQGVRVLEEEQALKEIKEAERCCIKHTANFLH